MCDGLADTIIGLYTIDLISQRGPWKNLDEVEYATLEWVDWFNNRRLFEPIGEVPRLNLKWRIVAGWKSQPWRHDSAKIVSGITGVIHRPIVQNDGFAKWATNLT